MAAILRESSQTAKPCRSSSILIIVSHLSTGFGLSDDLEATRVASCFYRPSQFLF
jgi:hypothetical protein